jgi:hypothetical protein
MFTQPAKEISAPIGLTASTLIEHLPLNRPRCWFSPGSKLILYQVQFGVIDDLEQKAPLDTGSIPANTIQFDELGGAIMEKSYPMARRVEPAWIDQSIWPLCVIVQSFRPPL